MTHTLTGLLLTTAAAFFAASTVIIGGPLAAQAAQLPANEYETFTLSATGATYLSPTKLTEVTGASVTINDIIKPESNSSYPSLDLWKVSEITEDTTRHQQLEPETRILVFDHDTAELINCCNGNINGNGLILQSGIAGYAFPVGTAKQTYQVFDTVTDAPEPATYTGTDTVGGIPVYVFAENLTAVKAGTSALSPTRTQLYTVHRLYWVDPETGLVLKMSEDEDLYLAGNGPARTTLLKASLTMPAATVAKLARQDAGHRNRIALWATARLVCLCLAGVLALIAAWLLIPWSGRRGGRGRGGPLPVARPLPPGDRLAPADEFPRRRQLLPDGQFPPGEQ
jgi:hypothetical protein